MDEAEYPGIRVSIAALFDGVVTPLKIDISTGDVITPREVGYRFKLMPDARTIHIMAYNVGTVLAEKLESIITRAVTNTRMRDFYDIYILQRLWMSYQKKFSYAADIDWKSVMAAVRESVMRMRRFGFE